MILSFSFFAASSSHTPLTDRKPPPLIQASTSEATPTSSGQQVSPVEMSRKKSTKGGAKRKKYCSEDERVCKEKERRNANNQRERWAFVLHCISVKLKPIL